MASCVPSGRVPRGIVLNRRLGLRLRRLGGIAQLVEQTAHIRCVIGPSPIAANFLDWCSVLYTPQSGAIAGFLVRPGRVFRGAGVDFIIILCDTYLWTPSGMDVERRKDRHAVADQRPIFFG